MQELSSLASLHPEIAKAARPLLAALADPAVQQRLVPVVCAAMPQLGPSEAWTLGGCYPLALGLAAHLGSRASIWGVGGGSELSLVHAFVRVGDVCIDGLNVASAEGLLAYWRSSLDAVGNGPATLYKLTRGQLISASNIDRDKRDLVAEGAAVERFLAEKFNLMEPLRQALEHYA